MYKENVETLFLSKDFLVKFAKIRTLTKVACVTKKSVIYTFKIGITSKLETKYPVGSPVPDSL